MSERAVPPADEATVESSGKVRDPSQFIAFCLIFFGLLCIGVALWRLFSPMNGSENPTAGLAAIEATAVAGRGWGSLVLDAGGILFGSTCCILGTMLRWA